MYPGLCALFHQHGYALAVHGSLARDFDLIAVPWVDIVSPPEVVLKHVTRVFALKLVDTPVLFDVKPHGRIAYTLSCGFGECCVDLSFVPASTPPHLTQPLPCAPAPG